MILQLILQKRYNNSIYIYVVESLKSMMGQQGEKQQIPDVPAYRIQINRKIHTSGRIH